MQRTDGGDDRGHREVEMTPRLRGPLLARAWRRFMSDPASMRNAMGAIVAATLLTVVLGGIAIRVFDPTTFSNIGMGMWWAIQTVTTVGYGDIVPQTTVGRAVGALVMLESVAFLAIVTAAITSIFVEDRQAVRHAVAAQEEAAHRARLEASLEEVLAQLERLQRAADSGGGEGEAGRPQRPDGSGTL